MGRLKSYVELARPFTLLPPALGVLSGAVTAWGARHARSAPSDGRTGRIRRRSSFPATA